jgi:hypothetical protein
MDYSSTDAFWTTDGDYSIGNDGDIEDTSDDALASLVQEIQTIVKSEIQDWQLDPSLGATLSDFVGEGNTRENGQKIETRIQSKVLEAGILQSQDFVVRVVPISIYQIMILVNVSVTMVQNSQLVQGNKVSVGLIWDSQENGIMTLAPKLNS